METRKRSIAKTLSWRTVAVVITATISYKLTGSAELAAEIGILDTIIKIGAYYGHERAWIRINYGRPPQVPPPEYQI